MAYFGKIKLIGGVALSIIMCTVLDAGFDRQPVIGEEP